MIRKYLTETEFENLDGLYNSNVDYIVVDEDSNPKKVVLKTNNLTGETITFDVEDEYPTPTGAISITENGENIDVKEYATANVNVKPQQFDINGDKIKGANMDSNGVIDISFSEDPAHIDSIVIYNALVDNVSFDTDNVIVSNEVVRQSGNNVLIAPESGQNYFIVEKDDSEEVGIWTIKLNNKNFITVVL